MKRLFKVLPPFAPDYSGVCSVLFELGGLCIILDASGCTGNYTGYDEPRWYDGSGNVLCSGLREMDAVMGDEAKLFQKIEEYLTVHRPRFIALLGSPAPMVIGMDYKALAVEVEARYAVTAFAFDTSGMAYYERGASRALVTLAERFVRPPLKKVANGLNIIGATPLDLGNPENLKQLIARLEDVGYRVMSCWSMGSCLEEIFHAAEAGLNLVISGTGLAAARYLEKVYGMPYLVGIPVGERATTQFFEKMRRVLDHGFTGQPDDPAWTGKEGRALVIGEQVMANSIRQCLQIDFGFHGVDVASFFAMDKTLMASGDEMLQSEADLAGLGRTGAYQVILGDPLYRAVVDPSGTATYIGLPHYAVSSKIYRSDHHGFVGEEGKRIIAAALKGSQGSMASS